LRVLRMVRRKVTWLAEHETRLLQSLRGDAEG
jgi:hypothetical protein